MFVEKFKQIQKRISEFRSEALLGRYTKALQQLQDILMVIGKMQVDAAPRMSKQLQELRSMLQSQGTVIRQIYTDYLQKPVLLPVQPQKQPNVQGDVALRESQIGKWGSLSATQESKIRPSVTLSSVESPIKNKQQQQQPTRKILAVQSLKDLDYNQELKDKIEEKLVMPFTMPQFFKKITTKVVLLYGPESVDKRFTIRAIVNKTSCKLQQISYSLLKGGQLERQQLSTLIEMGNTPNSITVAYDIQQCNTYQQKLLAKMSNKIKDNKLVKSILIMTSNEPWKIQSELVTCVSLALRLESRCPEKDAHYIEFEEHLAKQRSNTDI